MQNPLGFLTQPWIEWFTKAYNRMGGDEASTNTELQTEIDANEADIDTINGTLTNTVIPYLIPTGGFIPFGGTSAPTGFLLCNGAAVSRTTYAALFAVIGTTYGVGDGSTTFNLPAEGVFFVNKEASGTFQTLGGTGGAESVSLPNHAHSVNITTSGPTGATSVTPTGVNVASTAHTHSVSGNTGNPTSNPAIATIPPFQVVNYIIKT
jgi:microcystin-dependent protein